MTKEKKTPELRFPGFDEEWKERKLGDVCDYVDYRGKTPSKTEDGIFLVTAKNVKDGYIDYEISKEYVSEEDYEEVMHRGKPELGDVLITTEAPYGNVAQVNRTDIALAQRIIKYRGHKNIIDNTYLKQCLLGPTFQSVLATKSTGGTVKGIKGSVLHQQEIFCPSYDEQQEIGEFLTNLDNTITLHQQKLDKLKERKKGLLQKMFPKEGEKVPEIRFPGFTDDWEKCKVQDIYKITRGYVLAAPETNEIISDEMPYPVYSSQTKNNGLMGYYKDYLYENAITWTTDGANAGTVNYRAGKFYCTNVCGVLLSEKGYANKCAAEALNSVAWKWVSHVGNPKLMNNVMSEIPIILPKSLEEQNRISCFFEQLDKTITLQEHKLEKLKERKKGLLQKMFV